MSEPDARSSGIVSPLTGGATRLSATLESRIIVDRYRDIGLDVAATFADFPQVDIHRCNDTGYRFFHPPALAGEAAFYEQLHKINANATGEEHEYRAWSEDFQFAWDRIVPGERLLDVGCGNGAFLQRAAEKAEVTGIDGSQYAKRHCERLGLDVRLGMIADFAGVFAEQFDTVCAFQLLEHVYDVRSFLDGLVAVTKPGGRLIIAVPNNEPYIRRFDPYSPLNCPPHHIGLWNRTSLTKMADVMGLVPVEHHYCEVSGRWPVEAYLHARSMLNITNELHRHSLSEKLKMLAMAPYTVPMSLIRHARKGGRGTRNVIAMTFEKPVR